MVYWQQTQICGQIVQFADKLLNGLRTDAHKFLSAHVWQKSHKIY